MAFDVPHINVNKIFKWLWQADVKLIIIYGAGQTPLYCKPNFYMVIYYHRKAIFGRIIEWEYIKRFAKPLPLSGVSTGGKVINDLTVFDG